MRDPPDSRWWARHTADLNVVRGRPWGPEEGGFTETLGPSEEGLGAVPGTVLKPFFLFCARNHTRRQVRGTLTILGTEVSLLRVLGRSIR